MIFLEGTPYDAGRTIYFDGLTLRYKTEADDLALFAYYSKHKDTAVFINDQNRALRRGDIFTAGTYWTHHFSKEFNTDLYYIYTKVNDDDVNSGGNSNAYVNTVGGRVFGAPHDLMLYSVEYAREYGESSRGMDFTGSLFDGRLTLLTPEDVIFDPTLMLQFTSLSGDDPSSTDEFEGWDPIYAQYPIFREELLPIMLRDNWTNLDQYRAQLVLHLTEKMTFTGAYAYLSADYGEAAPGFGGGDSIGQLLSGFLDIKLTRNLSVAFEAAAFMPSSYWVDGHNCEWLRFQTVYRF
jgi:hypothetical protein